MTQYAPTQPRPKHPSDDPKQAAAMQRLFMIWFLAALGVLFVASIVLYVVTWSQQPTWPPPGSPGLPLFTLGLATVLILASSVTVGMAVKGATAGKHDKLMRGLWLTLALGVGFLVVQTVNWVQLAQAHQDVEMTLFGFLFYALTATHAAHVFAGFVPLVVVLVKARQGGYRGGPVNGVRMLGWYWHFLDAVWLVLLALIVVSYWPGLAG